MQQLNAIDLGVIVAYFAVVLAIGWWAARRQRDQTSDYFLAGRETGWFVVGASMFASNIGSEHLVGLAGGGAAGGMAIGHFEWLAALVILLLGWLFVPFYLRSGVTTMPEFLERRYNRSCRIYFTTITIIAYVLTKISVGLYAGGVVIQHVTGLDLWYSSAAVVVITGLYTLMGGLRAVLYTDAMQAIVFVVGMALLLVFGLTEVGGWSALVEKAPPGHFSMWKPSSDPQLPWTGIVFGAPILGVWYWCTDQYIVQRVLSARSKGVAQTACVFAGYLKILPVFLFVVPGIIAATLYADITPETSDQALTALVLRALPAGARGVVLAALLAALMSSLSSVFNSCSTLVTWDLYRLLHPGASEKTLVRVGQLATGLLVILGLLWIPFMKFISSQLFLYLQSISGYIAPPIAACFFFGLFSRRLTGPAALTTMLAGFAFGAMRLGLELANGTTADGLPAGSVWEWLAEINFLHFAAILFGVSTVILVAVSRFTPPPTERQLAEMTWQTAAAGEVDPGGAALRRRTNIGLSVALVMIVAALWTLFA